MNTARNSYFFIITSKCQLLKCKAAELPAFEHASMWSMEMPMTGFSCPSSCSSLGSGMQSCSAMLIRLAITEDGASAWQMQAKPRLGRWHEKRVTKLKIQVKSLQNNHCHCKMWLISIQSKGNHMEADYPWSAAASLMSSWHTAHGGNQDLPVGKHCISPIGCLFTNGYPLAASNYQECILQLPIGCC